MGKFVVPAMAACIGYYERWKKITVAGVLKLTKKSLNLN